ncbi:MAG TPA: CehA/McbA family metallohydrolase [Coriobacteriia bacterium]|nr:CehA/McbA family metallohydrolase [Coriobacteriia bacterium]
MRPHLSAADLHVHTTASDGTASPADVLEWASEATDLAVVAICDHNTNEGALEAASIAHRYRVEVVVGQEVESSDGHILGLWTPEWVRPGRPAAETVSDIHRQGGLAIVAHPFAPRWWHKHGLCRGEPEVYDRVAFDGVEVANSTPLLFLANVRARHYWRGNRARLAATGGSDAHMLSVVGTSRTAFPGSTAEDLRVAIERRETRGWGPSIQPLRALRYALKVPEIKERDAERKQREAERGVEGCAGCDSCNRNAQDKETDS